jgi:hypothetical protein
MQPHTSLLLLNDRHGREKPLHRAMKQTVAKLYLLLGWIILFEEQLCDVVAFKCRPNGRLRLVGVEPQTVATRHVCVNVRRDLAGGCAVVLLVAPSQQVRAALKRIIRRDLPRELWLKVGFTTVEQIQQAIARLEANHAPNHSKQ